jgi:hypothetical protein
LRETFLGRTWMFFWGGRGRGRGTPGHDCRDVFAGRREFQTSLCYVLYILQWRCPCRTCLQVIAKAVLDPRLSWTDTYAVRLRQPVDLVHALKTVKGLLLLVPPRTPRSSGYVVYAHAFYVVMCYMSMTCICLLYVVICYMSVCFVSSLGGVVRVRLYIIYAHLCNHIRLSSGGGTWDTALYPVRGVGSGSRDVDVWRANGCTPRIGGSKYRWPWSMETPHRT